MSWTPDQIGDLSGTTALVTGANSGIGLVEARELARHGADVVLAVRDTDAGEAAAERIRAAGVTGTTRVERLDLASQESVHSQADLTPADGPEHTRTTGARPAREAPPSAARARRILGTASPAAPTPHHTAPRGDPS